MRDANMAGAVVTSGRLSRIALLRPTDLELVREWPTDLRGTNLSGANLQKAD
jgi:uncharacterized protein YjbI with pentapeptide repeats